MSFSASTPRPTSSATPAPAETDPSEEGKVSAQPPDPELPLWRSRRGRRLAKPLKTEGLTGVQRLLLLDTWRRSGLPAGDFAPLVGVSKHTLYAWKHKFETEGPAGLEEKPRGGPTGSRLPERFSFDIALGAQDPIVKAYRNGDMKLVRSLVLGRAFIPADRSWANGPVDEIRRKFPDLKYEGME